MHKKSFYRKPQKNVRRKKREFVKNEREENFVQIAVSHHFSS